MAFMLLLAAAAHTQHHGTLAQLKHSKVADNTFVNCKSHAVFVITHGNKGNVSVLLWTTLLMLRESAA